MYYVTRGYVSWNDQSDLASMSWSRKSKKWLRGCSISFLSGILVLYCSLVPRLRLVLIFVRLVDNRRGLDSDKIPIEMMNQSL